MRPLLFVLSLAQQQLGDVGRNPPRQGRMNADRGPLLR